MNLLRRLPLLALVLSLTGCAGGWRGGVAPAQWADGASGGSTIEASAAAVPAKAGSAKAVSTKSGVTSADGTAFMWSGEGASVALAGEFNAWSTSADPLTKQADGSWRLVKKLEPGRYMYKFVVDGTNWKPDPNATDKADDGFGGTNSVVIVGAAGAATVTSTPAAPATAKAAVAGKGPANTADGTTFMWSGEGASVALAGEFNAWSTSADPLTKQADGSWKLVKKLEPGRYMYKLVVDGTNWKPDPNATEKADDGFGGTNSVVIVGAGGAATAATGSTPPPAASAPKAVSGSARAPVASADGVLFTHAGVARTVALCGDFNGWAPLADAMSQKADGTWTLRKKLAAGKHQYKFLVDGAKWATDPANPVSEDDGFGGKNSVIVVK